TPECRSYSMSVSSSTNTWGSLQTSSWGSPNPFPVVMPGYTSHLWAHNSHPQFWTKYQVWDWLQQVMDMHQIDASNIAFQNFDMDGHQLCNLGYQDFILIAGSVGPILFHSITELKLAGQCHMDRGQPELKAELILIRSKNPVSSMHCRHFLFQTNYMTFLFRYLLSFPTDPRGTHLWEFIRDILLNPERHPGLIKWEDRTEGIFRFLKSEAVAQLWGKKKNNSSMTYEKLSRAMRYYYKREILERVDGRRLVYKFGRNARGWKESEK
uniref:ETS homologous factor n=1 Tax=Mola mola TaxID=94237 RepID=A0A3Q3XC97_MOLML